MPISAIFPILSTPFAFDNCSTHKTDSVPTYVQLFYAMLLEDLHQLVARHHHALVQVLKRRVIPLQLLFWYAVRS